MTNHVHLLFRVGTDERLSIIEADSYLLRCMAYVALNPVRAGMVADPLAYPWSAHRAVCEEDAERIDLGPEYLACGPDATSRSRLYQQIVADERGRPAVSLARVHFVGRPRFVRRMETRFGLNRPDALLRRTPMGSELLFVGPRSGRGPARSK